MVICITGNSGSGKTTLADKLGERGYPVLHIDDITHEIISEKYTEYIKDEFGIDFTENTRKIFGDFIFNNREKYDEFSKMLGEDIKDCVRKFVSNNDFCIIEWILLPKIMNVIEKPTYNILIDSEFETRKEKVMKRDNIDESYFNNREMHSIDYSRTFFNMSIHNKYDGFTNSMVESVLSSIKDYILDLKNIKNEG